MLLITYGGLSLPAFAKEDDEGGEGKAVVDRVGGEDDGFGQEHGGGASNHGGDDVATRETTRQEECETQGE